MKHTPGPWIWKQNRGNNKFEHCVLKEDDYRIVIADLNGTDPDEIKANARLIAEAPELLFACIEAKTIIYNLCNNLEKREPEELQAIFDVIIKKATDE